MEINSAFSNIAEFNSIDPGWYNEGRKQVGLLAKSVDMPRFTMSNETLNQYNKKVVVQSKINYSPVSIAFHDDMSNITTNLWKNYYQYYYADSRYNSNTSIPEAYKNTQFSNKAYAYGLNNKQTVPFFTSITIYMLNRRQYNSVKLINPIITEWAHDQLDQTQSNKLLSNKMTVSYEAVYYNTKNTRITKSTPGFQNTNYDNSPSPLSVAGKGGSSLFGEGGMIAGATDIFGSVSDGLENGFSALDVLSIAVKGNNLVKNAQKLTKQGITQEAYSIVSSTFSDTIKGAKADPNSVLNKRTSSPASVQINGTTDTRSTTTTSKSELK
jgi:hypothetical protein